MTADEMAKHPMLTSMRVRIPGFVDAHGEPLAFTVRALTFRERMKATRAATKAGVAAGLPNGFCEETWALEVVLAGLVEPALTEAQREILLDYNAWIVDQLADAITRLGALPQDVVDAELRALAQSFGADAPSPPGDDRA